MAKDCLSVGGVAQKAMECCSPKVLRFSMDINSCVCCKLWGGVFVVAWIDAGMQ